MSDVRSTRVCAACACHGLPTFSHHLASVCCQVLRNFQSRATTLGKRNLPSAPKGSLQASISVARATRARKSAGAGSSTSRVFPSLKRGAPPSRPASAAFAELHSKNVTILRGEVALSTCAQLRQSATREEYTDILGDKLRGFAAGASMAPVVTRLVEQVCFASLATHAPPVSLALAPLPCVPRTHTMCLLHLVGPG